MLKKFIVVLAFLIMQPANAVPIKETQDFKELEQCWSKAMSDIVCTYVLGPRVQSIQLSQAELSSLTQAEPNALLGLLDTLDLDAIFIAMQSKLEKTPRHVDHIIAIRSQFASLLRKAEKRAHTLTGLVWEPSRNIWRVDPTVYDQYHADCTKHLEQAQAAHDELQRQLQGFQEQQRQITKRMIDVLGAHGPFAQALDEFLGPQEGPDSLRPVVTATSSELLETLTTNLGDNTRMLLQGAVHEALNPTVLTPLEKHIQDLNDQLNQINAALIKRQKFQEQFAHWRDTFPSLPNKFFPETLAGPYHGCMYVPLPSFGTLHTRANPSQSGTGFYGAACASPHFLAKN